MGGFGMLAAMKGHKGCLRVTRRVLGTQEGLRATGRYRKILRALGDVKGMLGYLWDAGGYRGDTGDMSVHLTLLASLWYFTAFLVSATARSTKPTDWSMLFSMRSIMDPYGVRGAHEDGEGQREWPEPPQCGVPLCVPPCRSPQAQVLGGPMGTCVAPCLGVLAHVPVAP